ncbi:hypothetical protein F7725_012563 [Dissostichus mawsoni]|uniref:MOB kinase activator 1A n=1 Tax=Dissostichus mawsoni TaxID=36200 RepID=A0A7J5YPA2_DISMA|nr:hypothetical protein F7725_012563 [Dissostichus mawsoni]
MYQIHYVQSGSTRRSVCRVSVPDAAQGATVCRRAATEIEEEPQRVQFMLASLLAGIVDKWFLLELLSRLFDDRFAKMSFLFGNRSSKTFKPKKNIPEGSHQYELLKHAEATLGSGNLRQAVMLPEGEDLNEWIAVNTVDFFNQINMLYGTITEFCTETSCSVMSAGPRYEYHWADGTNIKKPIKCSAPKYIDYLMTWEFPFPKNFMSVAKTILKRLFRVYAHIYHQHFDSVMQLQEEAHLNTSSSTSFFSFRSSTSSTGESSLHCRT